MDKFVAETVIVVDQRRRGGYVNQDMFSPLV